MGISGTRRAGWLAGMLNEVVIPAYAGMTAHHRFPRWLGDFWRYDFSDERLSWASIRFLYCSRCTVCKALTPSAPSNERDKSISVIYIPGMTHCQTGIATRSW